MTSFSSLISYNIQGITNFTKLLFHLTKIFVKQRELLMMVEMVFLLDIILENISVTGNFGYYYYKLLMKILDALLIKR